MRVYFSSVLQVWGNNQDLEELRKSFEQGGLY